MAADRVLAIGGVPTAPVEVARTLRERSRGLLGRDGIAGALWLEPAQSVHTFGMRFAIDVAFVDRHGIVARTVTVAANRMTRIHLRARAVVEAEAGGFAAWGLTPGVRLEVVDADHDPPGP